MGAARTKRVVVALLLATAIAVVSTGCGGGDSNNAAPDSQSSFSDYETAMQRLSQSLGTALRDAGLKNRDASKAVIVKNLRHSQSELRAAAVKLEKITPPDQIKAQHQALVKGVRLYAVELDTVISKVQHGGGVGALTTIESLKGIEQMGKATQAITNAGYVICLNC